MNVLKSSISAMALLLTPVGVALSQTGNEAYPFPQHRVYATGTIKPNSSTLTQAELDKDVIAYYETWKKDYLAYEGTTEQNKPIYRIAAGASGLTATPVDSKFKETGSEGQGYGMIIVALMAGYDPEAQTIFDGLWRFVSLHRSSINPTNTSLMSWSVIRQDDAGATPTYSRNMDSAFDGDADIAYALLLANKQWSGYSPDSDIQYGVDAAKVLDSILKYTIGINSHLPILGDQPLAQRIYTPNHGENDEYSTRSSDFMVSHFRTFQRFTGLPQWGNVIKQVQETVTKLQATYSPKTGLLPDFIVRASPTSTEPKPAPTCFLKEFERTDQYNWNAARTPWRLGMDVLLNNDQVSRLQVDKMTRWIQVRADGDPMSIYPGYTLDGVALDKNDPKFNCDTNAYDVSTIKAPQEGTGYFYSNAFIAPFGVAAMINPDQQQWLNSIYISVRGTHMDYYADSLTLLSMLVMTGNYWDPSLP